MNRPSRRTVLGAALTAAATAALPRTGAAAATTLSVSSWQQRWAPSAAADGLAAFETIEDDRADSHPAGHPHIRVENGNYRWNMHTVDRDSATDRQRHEVTGMRSPAGGAFLEWRPGQTWRTTYSMYIPSSLKATTTFTHIMQMKQPGNGTSPIVVQSLRRGNGAQTIELQLPISGVLVGRTSLDPLHDRWVDVDFQIKVGDGSSGSVRWILRSAGNTLIDVSKTGVDTFLADRVRPKWGIYRSLGDTSGSLQDCYLLTTAMRGYQLVSGASGVYQAAEARIVQGTIDTDHAGFSGSGFLNLANSAGSYAEWTVPASAASAATLDLTYANGTGADRPMDVTVNGARVATGHVFPPTADWATWSTTSLPIPLKAGANTVRVTSTTADGGPNLDRITVR
ncbi:hypothetical protein GCM10010505_38620 [Kitasatospora aburaviensis]